MNLFFVKSYTLYFVALGGFTLIASYIYCATYTFTGERQTRRLRETFLKSVIRQNIGWFDNQSAGQGMQQYEISSHDHFF